MSDKEFLQWIWQRMVNLHGEESNIDYMLRLNAIILSFEDDDVITPVAFGEKQYKEETMNYAQDHLTVSDEQEYKNGDEVDISKMRRGRWYYIGKSKCGKYHIVQSHKSCSASGYHGGDLYEVSDEYISKAETPEDKINREINELAVICSDATYQWSASEMHKLGIRAVNGELVRVDNE